MKNSKGKFRLFGFINPVDVVIAAGAVIFISWAVLVFSAPQTVTAKPGDVIIRYTVELTEKEAGFHKKINAGAALYDSVKGYAIGTITEVYALPYREDAPDEENGIFRRAPVDGLEFVYIVAEASAQITDAAVTVGQYDIFVNKEVFVKSKTFAGPGYIIAVERIG